MAAKAELRRLALTRRAAEPDREGKSARIAERVVSLPAFRAAGILSSYVGVGDEVATEPLLRAALEAGRVVAVPWRRSGELGLAAIATLNELAPATFGLLEPIRSVTDDPSRAVDPATLDLLLIPGVAFDRRGGRLGHGRGFYDRLLRRCRAEALRVGLGFECQVFEEIPMDEGDERIDLLVTERGGYQLSERAAWAAR